MNAALTENVCALVVWWQNHSERIEGKSDVARQDPVEEKDKVDLFSPESRLTEDNEATPCRAEADKRCTAQSLAREGMTTEDIRKEQARGEIWPRVQNCQIPQLGSHLARPAPCVPTRPLAL